MRYSLYIFRAAGQDGAYGTMAVGVILERGKEAEALAAANIDSEYTSYSYSHVLTVDITDRHPKTGIVFSVGYVE